MIDATSREGDAVTWSEGSVGKCEGPGGRFKKLARRFTLCEARVGVSGLRATDL